MEGQGRTRLLEGGVRNHTSQNLHVASVWRAWWVRGPRKLGVGALFDIFEGSCEAAAQRWVFDDAQIIEPFIGIDAGEPVVDFHRF